MAQERLRGFDPDAHYGLVVAMTQQIVKAYGLDLQREDLFQAGFCGLLEASTRYDPAHGVRVSTFVSFRIWGSMVDYRRNLSPVRIPRERQQELREVDRAREQLAQRLQRSPTAEEVAAALSITSEQLRDIEQARIQIIPSISTAHPDEAPTPEAIAVTRQLLTRKALLLEALEVCIRRLPSPQRELWLTRKAQPSGTVQQRAQVVGLTAEQARQQESRAKTTLKSWLVQQGWTAGAVADVWRAEMEA